MKVSKFSKIKKGEFFRFPGEKKVYVFDGGGKVKGFRYHCFEDHNTDYTTKTDRDIEIRFTF